MSSLDRVNCPEPRYKEDGVRNCRSALLCLLLRHFLSLRTLQYLQKSAFQKSLAFAAGTCRMIGLDTALKEL
jgi:hypothetical protein